MSAIGAKIAERGPTQTCASPARSRCHSSRRSPGRELGVQDRDGVAEAVDEARDDLRRQRDLGHEHDRAAALGERRRGGLQVDLGLARAGDAVQQQPRRIARRDRRLDLGEGGRLVGGQLRLRAPRADGGVLGRAAHGAALEPHEPAALEAPQRGEVLAGDPRRPHRREQRGLALREPVGRADRLRPPRHARLRAGVRGDEREPARRRRAVLDRDPARELDEIDGQLRVEHLARRDEPVVGDLGLLGDPDDDAEHVAVAERDDEHRPHADALGPQVVERPAQRTGRRDGLDPCDRRHPTSVHHEAASLGSVVLAPSQSVTPARVAAFTVLRRVAEQGAYADRALHAEARDLVGRDRAFARQLDVRHDPAPRLDRPPHRDARAAGRTSWTPPSPPRCGSGSSSCCSSTACPTTPRSPRASSSPSPRARAAAATAS